jgi:hypothetical protein
MADDHRFFFPAPEERERARPDMSGLESSARSFPG